MQDIRDAWAQMLVQTAQQQGAGSVESLGAKC
jgi:hypothetical protein